MNNPKAVVYLAIDNPKNTIQYGGGADIIAPGKGTCYKMIKGKNLDNFDRNKKTPFLV